MTARMAKVAKAAGEVTPEISPALMALILEAAKSQAGK